MKTIQIAKHKPKRDEKDDREIEIRHATTPKEIETCLAAARRRAETGSRDEAIILRTGETVKKIR